MYEITNEDLTLVLQQSASIQTPRLVLEVLDSNQKIIGVITTLLNGSMSISSESDIRRNGNFTIVPTLKEKIRLHPDNLIWMNKDLRLKLGLYNIREKKYKYYTLAYFVYESTSFSYDAATSQISLRCSDFIRKLDGTKNGQLGALLINFDAYEKDTDGNPLLDENGNILKYNTIREAVVTVLEKLGQISHHRVEDIGEYKGMPDYNENYEQYRAEHETWNALPYDEKFSCGCSVLSILTTFRDLYPNYEMFFDPSDGNRFICQMIPFCYEDDITLDNAFLQKVLISEDTTVDMSTVRNICEVWGKTIDTKFYTEDCTCSNNVYSCTVSGFDTKYYNNDTISVKIPAVNQDSPKLDVNHLGAIDIYAENTDLPLTANALTPAVYSFKMKKVKKDDAYIFRAYLLGQWQAHAIDILSDGAASKTETYTTSDGKTVAKYSKEYFQDKYNCENIHITTIRNSPFTVQNLGEILDVKTGGEYEKISSDSLALDRAVYENWKNCRLTDQITITTVLLPFLDVNKKVSYKPANSDEERQYIIKSINHDFTGYATTISMYRFYPSYRSLLKDAGTHTALSGYSHELLGNYTNEELITLLSKEDL